MKKQERDEPESHGEKRRQEFAPHENPNKQPDGDPGPDSAREGSVNGGGAKSPQTVQDKGTDD
jgi:hypothetical protein